MVYLELGRHPNDGDKDYEVTIYDLNDLNVTVQDVPYIPDVLSAIHIGT